MLDYFRKMDAPNTVLVLGNGFDLHCGLKSRFKDFFEDELKNKPCKIKSNIWYLIFYYAYMLDYNHGGSLVPFVNNSNPLWMDVETYIDNVFKTSNLMGILKIYDFIKNIILMNDDEFLEDSLVLNGDQKNQTYQIKYRVIELLKSKHYTSAEDLLFEELKRFETDFANYLKKQIQENKFEYTKNVDIFTQKIFDNHGTNELFILTFNYSNNFNPSIGDEKIVNVHGKLDSNNIIIGIGDYEKSGLPGRDSFKKSRRRILNKLGPLNLPKKEMITCVNFYGCSFSKQDWNYYHTIFQIYDLGNSEVVFKFLYSDYEDTDKKNEINRDKYYGNCEEVVNSYCKAKRVETSFNELCTIGKITFEPVK